MVVTFKYSLRVHQKEYSTDAAKFSLMVKRKNSLMNLKMKLMKLTKPSVLLEKEFSLSLKLISQLTNIQKIPINLT